MKSGDPKGDKLWARVLYRKVTALLVLREWRNEVGHPGVSANALTFCNYGLKSCDEILYQTNKGMHNR